MGLISQCIVAISVLSYTFYIVECVSSQEAREVCEQNLQNPDQVYTNKTVAHEFSKCMEVQLGKYHKGFKYFLIKKLWKDFQERAISPSDRNKPS